MYDKEGNYIGTADEEILEAIHSKKRIRTENLSPQNV